MFTSKTFWITFLLVFQFSSAFGQLKNIPDFFQASRDDAEKLMEGYLNPYAEALGNGLNAGWYNTAKPHKTLGFDITITPALVFIPEKNYDFDLNELDLTSISPTGDNIAPTIAGEKNGVELEHNQYSELSFNTPDGTDIATLPTPAFKAGVGLPLLDGTELMGRYVPRLSYDQANVRLWGIGAKHDILQYIPIVKNVPALNISIMAAYNNLSANKDVSYTPWDMDVDPTQTVKNNYDFEDQKVDLTTKSFTTNAIASLDLPAFTVFASAGLTSNTSTLELKGDYPVSVSEVNGNLRITDGDVQTNPVKLDFGGDIDDGLVPRYNAGVRFKLAVATLHVDYTYSTYSMLSGGIGVSFR